MPVRFLTNQEIRYLGGEAINFKTKGREYNFKSTLKKKMKEQTPSYFHDCLHQLMLVHDNLALYNEQEQKVLISKVIAEGNNLISLLKKWYDEDALMDLLIELQIDELHSCWSSSNVSSHRPCERIEPTLEYLKMMRFSDSSIQKKKEIAIEALSDLSKCLDGKVYSRILMPGPLTSYQHSSEGIKGNAGEQSAILKRKNQSLVSRGDVNSNHYIMMEYKAKWKKWEELLHDEDCYLKIPGKQGTYNFPAFVLYVIDIKEPIDVSSLIDWFAKDLLIENSSLILAFERKFTRILNKMVRYGILKKDGKLYKSTKEGRKLARYVRDLNRFDGKYDGEGNKIDELSQTPETNSIW